MVGHPDAVPTSCLSMLATLEQFRPGLARICPIRESHSRERSGKFPTRSGKYGSVIQIGRPCCFSGRQTPASTRAVSPFTLSLVMRWGNADTMKLKLKLKHGRS